MWEFLRHFEQGLLDLAAGLAVYLLLLAIARLVKRFLKVPLGHSFHLFALFSGLLGAWYAHRFRIGFDAPLAAWLPPARDAVFAVWVIFLVLQLEKFLSRFFWDALRDKDGTTKVPKLLRDLAKVLLLILAVLWVMKFVYGRELSALLTASGIVAVVLGFALQNLLGDVVAGIAINMEKPYDIGDWIEVDGIDGEVVEINWRATRIRTRADNHRVIPNGTITKQVLVNYHYPTPDHALLCTVGVEYSAAPNEVRHVLCQAVSRTPGVLPREPRVRLKSFGDSSILYEVKFWIANPAEAHDLHSDVMINIWYALRRARISIPFPIRDVYLHQPTEKTAVDDLRRVDAVHALGATRLFQMLEKPELETLATGSRMLRFGHGETVIRQGDAGDSLFVIARGHASVTFRDPASPSVVPNVTLNPGDTFGEMSMLTGAPRSATVTASGDLRLVEVPKSALAPILAAKPEIAEALSSLMADRQIHREGLFKQNQVPADLAAKRDRYASGILRGISQFFKL